MKHNPIRWWLGLVIRQVLWWTKVRLTLCRPKPNRAARCAKGHLALRYENGVAKESCGCS